jgi:hypothetical protein
MKFGKLRRCVPAWKTRPVRRNVSRNAKLAAIVFEHGFSQ